MDRGTSSVSSTYGFWHKLKIHSTERETLGQGREKKSDVKWALIFPRLAVYIGIAAIGHLRSFRGPSALPCSPLCDPKNHSERVPNYRSFGGGLQCVKLTRRDRVDSFS